MARKKLEAAQLKKLEALVMEGKTPEDISKYFNIAVSSVHNYKRMLKERGIKIPDIRGKRPVGLGKASVPTITSPKSDNTPIPTELAGFMKLAVNDVLIYVSPNAKSVRINDHEIIVQF
jgi:hypothetical protein